MSNLLKPTDYLRFNIAAFEADEAAGTKQKPVDRGRGAVVLPAGRRSNPSGGKPAEEVNLRDRIAMMEKEAYEKGFEQGHKDGLALGEKRVEQTLSQMKALLEELGALKARIYREAEKELVELSVEVAKRVVKSEIDRDNEVAARAVRSALGFLVDKSVVRVLISPEDAREVQRLLPDFAEQYRVGKLQVVEDRSIQRGGCMIETGFGRINATLEDQFSTLKRALDEEFEMPPECLREED